MALPPEDAKLLLGVEALSTFKKRVDAVLDDLNGSPANSGRVADLTLQREALAGAGAFGEASGLYAQYARAHSTITSLSKTLGLQIEALRIAVHGADVGFDNLEEEARRRFHEIRMELERDQQHSRTTHVSDRQFEGGF